MQDRFKFRVWDKINEIWVKNFSIDEQGCVEGFYNPPQAMNRRLVLMQSTGLKDKNGKLIYEGDIINDKSNHIRVVVWEQDCFKYPALKTSRYFHKPISNKLEERKVDLKGKLTFQDAIGKCDKKHFEVIGNIYENPELLED